MEKENLIGLIVVYSCTLIWYSKDTRTTFATITDKMMKLN